MKTRIDYRLVPKDSFEFGNLQDFAESFDHKIVGYIGVPLIDDRPKFTNDVMSKLGLTKMNREIYSYDSLT